MVGVDVGAALLETALAAWIKSHEKVHTACLYNPSLRND